VYRCGNAACHLTPSLFLGVAGIGFFYLMLLDPTVSSSSSRVPRPSRLSQPANAELLTTYRSIPTGYFLQFNVMS